MNALNGGGKDNGGRVVVEQKVKQHQRLVSILAHDEVLLASSPIPDLSHQTRLLTKRVVHLEASRSRVDFFLGSSDKQRIAETKRT